MLAGATAVAALATVAAPHRATAGGFFDFLNVFGAAHDGRYAPVTAYSDPRTLAERPLDLQAPASMAQGGTTYCVRLCDGRYFPLSSGAAGGNDGGARMCSALCPAARTAIFRGGDIDHAYGSRGERYADLAHAYVYRDRLVADCTCNGRDPFGLAPIDAANDPTLRPGDMVATESGLKVFNGYRSAHNTAAFTPVRRENATAAARRVIAATQFARPDWATPPATAGAPTRRLPPRARSRSWSPG
jgi:hypothetical protein